MTERMRATKSRPVVLTKNVFITKHPVEIEIYTERPKVSYFRCRRQSRYHRRLRQEGLGFHEKILDSWRHYSLIRSVGLDPFEAWRRSISERDAVLDHETDRGSLARVLDKRLSDEGTSFIGLSRERKSPDGYPCTLVTLQGFSHGFPLFLRVSDVENSEYHDRHGRECGDAAIVIIEKSKNLLEKSPERYERPTGFLGFICFGLASGCRGVAEWSAELGQAAFGLLGLIPLACSWFVRQASYLGVFCVAPCASVWLPHVLCLSSLVTL